MAIMKALSKITFICLVDESAIKVAKCQLNAKLRRLITDLEIESISADIADEELAGKISQIFKKLQYNNNPVIICLPRFQATFRYIKIPSQVPEEIQRIVSLQASQYLPYSTNELITGYQVIDVSRDGYSNLSMIIVRKGIIDRYLNIFKQVRAANLKIVLSSFGLCHLYSQMNPDDSGPTMIIDIDKKQVELAIAAREKLLFSRSFRFNQLQPNWKEMFAEEILSSQKAYIKEKIGADLKKAVLLGSQNLTAEIARILNLNLPVETLSYAQSPSISPDIRERILVSESSLASVIGLGLADIPGSLNLIPENVKELYKKAAKQKQNVRLVFLILATILIISAATLKSLANKEKNLWQIKNQLLQLCAQAKPLEEMEKKIQLLQARAKQGSSSLEAIYEIHRLIPAQVYLASLSYEEAKQVVIRGQTQELGLIFNFVANLEGSPAFKGYSVKVRYATKKRTQAGEIVDFEILCSKK